MMRESAVLIFLWYLTLACSAWTCGLVLGWISHGMGRIYGVVFCLTLLLGEMFGAPLYFSYVEHRLHHSSGVPARPDPVAAVFAVLFYRVMLPLIVQAVLVAFDWITALLVVFVWWPLRRRWALEL